MVYHYYMKKLSCGLLAFLFCFLFSSLFAQITVVRVEGNKIFMDTSSAPAVHKGDTFKVILSSEKLTNPQTGKELGLIYNYSSEGKITEVQPLYAIGTLAEKTKITVGQEVVLERTMPAATPAAAQQTPQAVTTHALTRYNPVEQEVISLTEGNFAQAPHAIATLSSKNKVTVWKRGENKNLEELLSYTLPTNKKGITLSAKDVKNAGSDQLFVTVYDPTRQNISTLVLEVQEGALIQTDTLPYFVKELGCGSQKTLWAQRPFVTDNRPGNAKEVVYKKNGYATGDRSFSTQHNWLTGLNLYPVQNDKYENLIYTSSNGKLRMILQNGKRTESVDSFASTPNRISYKQEIVRFYPSLQVFGTPGEAQLAAVENTSKLGLLSDAFGQYQEGKIQWLSYQQGRLQIQETTELNGVLYDTACTDEAILTAEVLTDETSTVVELLK